MIDLLTDVLAATRLTRLVVEDTFPPVKALRDRVVDAHSRDVPVTETRWVNAIEAEQNAEAFLGQPIEIIGEIDEAERNKAGHFEEVVIGTTKELDSWAELITCPWCAGMWVCLGVVVARRVAPRQWRPLAKALAASMVVGLIETKIDD